TFDEAIALAWVHGVEVRPYPNSLSKISPIWKAMDRFGVAKSDWLPYWSPRAITTDSPDVKISAWTHNGKALLVVSHLARTAATARVQLDPRKLSLRKGDLRARDALTNEGILLEAGTLELPFSGMNCRFVEVSR